MLTESTTFVGDVVMDCIALMDLMIFIKLSFYKCLQLHWFKSLACYSFIIIIFVFVGASVHAFQKAD
jgi:hypothetical protein